MKPIDPIKKKKEQLDEWLKGLEAQRSATVEEYDEKLAGLDRGIKDVKARIKVADKYKKQGV